MDNNSDSAIIKEKVLITGLTGYIGSWVGKMLLNQYSDKFLLKAAVRSKERASQLKENGLFGEALYNKIEFVEASLQNKEQLQKSVEGCQYIIHIANPLYSDKEVVTEDDLIGVVEQATKWLIEAAVEFKVKRIVVTSSIASVTGDIFKKDRGESHYDELDFAPERGDPYIIGKVKQEVCIREFLEKQEKSYQVSSKRLEIVILNVSYVLGPILIKQVQSSFAPILKLMTGQVPGVVQLMVPMVDVRTVAQAHLLALLKPGISNLLNNQLCVGGERIIIGEEMLWGEDVARILSEEFGQYGYKVPQNVIGYSVVKLASYFDPQLKLALAQWNQPYTVSAHKSKEIIGVEYDRKIKESIIELGYQFIEIGMMKDLRNRVLIS